MLPLIIQIEDTERREAESVAFNRSPVRVGRNPLNDLRLDQPFVSQWHAVIRLLDGRTTFLDLGATNATVINGRSVARNVEVEVDQDSDVRIGKLRLHFVRAPSPPDELFGQRRESAFARTGGQDLEDRAGSRTVALVNHDALKPSGPSPRPERGGPPGSIPAPELPSGGGARGYPSVQMPASSAPPPAMRQAERTVVEQSPRSAGGPAAGAPTPGAPSGSAPTASRPAPAGGRRSSRPAPAAPALQPPPLDAPAGDPTEVAYARYVSAREAMLEHVQQVLDSVPRSARAEAVRGLLGRFPMLGREPGLRQVVTHSGVDPLETGQPDMKDWLRRLTGGMYPPPGGRVNVAVAMERVGELLEVFSQAFVEIRNTQRKFRQEMALESSLDRSGPNATLHNNDSYQAILAYLLNEAPDDPERRPQDLARGLAEFAVHQVALVGAAMEGARSIVTALAPEETLADLDERPKRSWWFRRGASAEQLRERYRNAHRDLAEEDRFVRLLFGREFARRYYLVLGKGNVD